MNYWLFHNKTRKTKPCPSPKWIKKIFIETRSIRGKRTLKQKIKLLVGDIVYGLMSHIPVCCIAYFCILEWRKIEGSFVEYCGCTRQCNCNYIHCTIHQRKYHG